MENRKHITILLLTVVLFLFASRSFSQITGTNLAEFQYGNIPGQSPKNLTSLFDQLTLSYRLDKILIKTRLENFYPSFGEDRSYTRLSQYQFQYAYKGIKLQVGHLYQTIGRGLLLRSYEIPASIWETRGYRVRYGFYKDIHGLAASYTLKNLKVTALRGKVLSVDLPPTIDEKERRPDLVEAGDVNYSLGNHTLGMAFMRLTNASGSANFLTNYYEGSVGRFSVYGEFAQQIRPVNLISGNPAETAFGSYAGLNYSGEKLGAVVEYKYYTNFLLGAGINDPPTLVKEHSSRLLNRSTHIPVLTNESGYQLEMYYQFNGGSRITVNHALAKSRLTPEKQFIFTEYYTDYQVDLGEKFLIRLMADYAKDPFKGERNRFTGGLTLDLTSPGFSSSLELGYQYIQPVSASRTNFRDMLISYSLTRGSRYGITLIYEVTNDQLILRGTEKWASYPAVQLNWKPNEKNTLSLFIGNRRGGPACNSGICYEVLDFRGLELRLSSLI